MSDIVMRLRAVLAGFVEMTPDDVASTAQQVADELLRERKRREESERLLEELNGEANRINEMHTMAVARAEKAERERDEARYALQQAQEDLGVERHLRECAEADNAALLDDVSEAARLLREGHDPAKAGQVLAGALIAGRRGSAMLERMRALETWVTKAKERIESLAHADECSVEDPYDAEETDGCKCALALLDDVPETN